MYIHVSELHYFAGLQIWCNLTTSNVDQDDPVVEFAACRDILIDAKIGEDVHQANHYPGMMK